MADIVKLVDRGIPPTQRTQTFTNLDAGTGDIIMVTESMGRPASKVLIEAAAVMRVRFNVYHDVFPVHSAIDFPGAEGEPNLALGGTYKDLSAGFIDIGAGESYEMDGSYSTDDIEIVTASGNFQIYVS